MIEENIDKKVEMIRKVILDPQIDRITRDNALYAMGDLDSEIEQLRRKLAFYVAKCHRNEDCPNYKLVDELNRVKWLLPDEERQKINMVLDGARWNGGEAKR